MASYQWDRDPIVIRTDLSVSNAQTISIKANVDPDSSPLPTYTGISIGLKIRIQENIVEIENHYTSNTIEMQLKNMPDNMNGEVIWSLYKLNRKLVIECRANKVWEMDYMFDRKNDGGVFSQRSMRAWSKRVVEIMFDVDDTATIDYRIKGLASFIDYRIKGLASFVDYRIKGLASFALYRKYQTC